jgi:N6-L-threonylcarbamoyladenine synthase
MSGSPAPLTVLGIETSCDETAVAVLRLHTDGQAEVLADLIASQTEAHALYGGVVPEIAARAHAERLPHLLADAMAQSGEGGADLPWGALDGIAATAGPGLIGGVMTGLSAAKGLAVALNKPLLAVNHLEGHALSPRLSAPIKFPYLLLLVSGGHCQWIWVAGLGRYTRLGSTRDDAAGEAFDKTAKLLGLGFPGGPAVERAALTGDPTRFGLPRAFCDRASEAEGLLDMSFAGLKSAVARHAASLVADTATASQARADLCASFQAAVADVLATKAAWAMRRVRAELAPGDAQMLVVAGGVAANRTLRARLEAAAQAEGFAFHAPPLRHCTDNAAMIALAGAERLRAGLLSPLDAEARPRWPLDEAAAARAPTYGAGRKGAKA